MAPSRPSSPMAAATGERAAALPGGAEQGEGDGQVERRALFAHVGRREVDGDAPRGELVVRVDDRRAHALATLLHGRVGQPDDGEGRRGRHDVGFDGDGVAVETRQRFALDAGQHARSAAGIEGRPQVADARRPGEGVDRDDVEAHVGDARQGARMAAQPERGKTGDLAALAGRDGVFGRTAGARAARLDFDEGQHGAAPRDDVELAAADALVDGDDAVRLLLEVRRPPGARPRGRSRAGLPARRTSLLVRTCRSPGRGP